MMKSGSGLAAKSIERVLELSADAQINRRESGRVFGQVAKGVLRVPRQQNAPIQPFLKS
jgi:hypothetical protein